jgi:ATP-binding cassette subfamily B protein
MNEDRGRGMLSLLRPYRGIIIVIAAIQVLGALSLVQAITILKPMLYLATNDGDLDDILTLGIYLLLFTLIASMVIALTSYLASRVASGVSNSLRMRIMESTLDIQDLGRLGNSYATTMSGLTNDVSSVERYIFETLRTYLPMPFLLAILLYYTFEINWLVGLILLVTMIVISVLTLIISHRIHGLYVVQLKSLDWVNRLLREKITGGRTIRAFDAKEYETERFKEASSQLGTANRKILLNSYYIPNLSTAFMWLFVVFIFLDAALQGTGKIVPEEIIIFMQYSTYMVATLSIIPYLSVELPKARICQERINSITSAGQEARSKSYAPVTEDDDAPMVEVKGLVKVDTRGNHVLNGMDLEIPRGETVTMIGMNGSGATELFNLIMGFSVPTEGTIRIGGLVVGEVDPSEIRSRVSYAGNSMNILRGTMRYNLDPKGERTDDDILTMCERVGLKKFIDSFPEGLDHPVVDDISSMSGGQRLLVILVRSLLHDSDLHVFDDCFFSLDSVTKDRVLETIVDVCRDRTVVFIMHDVSTCSVSDRIILMEKGNVVDTGTHDDLLTRSKLYNDLYSVGQGGKGTWA